MDDLDAALLRYEIAMFLGSKVAANISAQGLDLCFAADAPTGLVRYLRALVFPERTRSFGSTSTPRETEAFFRRDAKVPFRVI